MMISEALAHSLEVHNVVKINLKSEWHTIKIVLIDCYRLMHLRILRLRCEPPPNKIFIYLYTFYISLRNHEQKIFV